MLFDIMNSTDPIVDVDYVLKYGDPRVKSLPLMDSPHKTYAAVLIFIIYIKIIAPIMMKNRKPYGLRTAMFLYNIVLVAVSAWMFYRFAAYGWFYNYRWLCEPLDFSNNDASVKILEAYYVYHLTKYIEFLDTIFFTLRKKTSQITFLHLFHHSLMPISTWYFVKYGCGGYATILPLANTFAHVMMYSYYLLSSFGPSVQKYIWWKRHVTNIQLFQFIVIMIFTGIPMIVRPEYCHVRNYTAMFTFLHGLVFIILFSHFYRNNYLRNKNIKST